MVNSYEYLTMLMSRFYEGIRMKWNRDGLPVTFQGFLSRCLKMSQN